MDERIEKPVLDGVTVIHDRAGNRQVMTAQGVVVLPVGSEVELMNPNVNAKVIGIRLLAGNTATVCLDVEVPDEWWSAHSEAD